MRWIYALRLRLRSLFRRSKVEEELNGEFQYHLDRQIEQNLARGMNAEEARFAALRTVGRVEQHKEECRDKRHVAFFDNLAQDLRYAVRTLCHRPGFAAVAILSLAFGIGVNTAVFSLLNALLLTKLPVSDPDHLYQLFATRRTYVRNGFSVTDYDNLRSKIEIFKDVTAWFHREWVFKTEDTQLPVHGALVSGNFYRFMGVKPLIGRLLEPPDDTAGGSAVLVLGYDFWQRAFSGDRGVIGKVVRVEGAAFTIIGVTPPGFGGAEADYPRDVILPIHALKRYDPKDTAIENPGAYFFSVLVRLKPGITMESARPVLRDLWPRLQAPTLAGDHFQQMLEIAPGSAGASKVRVEFSQALVIVMVLVAMVLLIMCANLANLLLVRALGRKKEIAVRLAIGAHRTRLIRQTLTEALLLAVIGGCGGVFLAPWFSRGLLLFLPAAQAGFLSFTLDTRVLLFGVLITIGTALVFGILPALQAVRVPLNVILGQAGRIPGAGRRPWMLRVVVAAQVAVSMVLLVGSLLFAKSLENISNADIGFRRDNMLLVDVNTNRAGIQGDQNEVFLKDLLDDLNATPGISSASLSRMTPLSGLQWWDVPFVPGYTPARDEVTTVYLNQVSPAYFQTLGIPLVEGRAFTAADDKHSRRVAIVSRSFARRFFEGRPALGRAITIGPGAGPEPRYEVFRNLEIVGVAADTKYSDPHEAQKDVVYFASYQAGPTADMRGSLEIRLAAGASAEQASRQIRAAVDRLSPGLDIDIRPYNTVFERSLQRDRLLAALAEIFGLLGSALACIGLYGVMSHAVTARTGEIGIRMTLGARRSQVKWMVLRETLAIAALGAAVGIPLALASGLFTRDLLFGLKPSDQFVFVSSLAIMILVSAAAAWIPARRAARLDPMLALRHE